MSVLIRKFLSFFLLAAISLFYLEAQAACDDALPLTGVRDDVLVLVNDNSVDSCAVAVHYATKRGLGRSNLVHLKAPASYFINWTDFKIMRDQILGFMRQNTFRDATVTPIVCPAGTESALYCQASMDQLRAQTKIKYIITTRGVPSRVVVDGSTLSSASAPASVDNYLRHWLVNFYDKDVPFNSLARAKAFGDGRGMRTVDPAVDGELIIGRIDGLDRQASMALVDRAIAAEANGIYGKHYGSKFGSTGGQAVWRNYAVSGYPLQYVYGDYLSGWQYQHGIFGAMTDAADSLANAIRFDLNVNCLTHVDSPANSAAGKSPVECVVKLTNGKDAVPGKPYSRQPIVDNALVYLGSLDGQPTNGSFSGFMNWRKNTTCSVTLCKNAADPVACRAASTDTLKEINTQCAGVADGFIGYNFQSFPVSFMGVWPTGWYQTTGNLERLWGHTGGGDINRLAFPEVVNGDSSDGDGYSVWFRNTDEIASPQCFTDTSLTGLGTCNITQKITAFVNKIMFSPRTNDPAQPDRYRISLKYKVADLANPVKLRLGVMVKEPGSSKFQVNYGNRYFRLPGDTVDHALPTGNSGWVEVEAFFTIDENKHAVARTNCQNNVNDKSKRCSVNVDATFLATPWNNVYEGIKLRLETSGVYTGGIGIDDVKIERVNDGVQLAMINPSFSAGHEQVAAGDHAANFLSRLNGTAFWGSVSHHQSDGHSFDKHPMETLLYFMRGLPLGDAVWFAEGYNSGMLYGDPLYSPIAVKFQYLNAYDFVTNGAKLYADTVNGHDSSIVATRFSVDYCSGKDFMACDKAGSWQPTGLSGNGGQKSMLLGAWDTTGIAAGQYTLRLVVTSTNSVRGKTQTFYDYYPVIVTTATSDYDNDGLTDTLELSTYGTNPVNADSDGDGLNDGKEIALGTNPLNPDTDGDALPDGWEAQFPGMNPLVNDAATDLDGDGLTNMDEFNRKTNPANADTDGDGLTDGEEVNTYLTNPLKADTDGDRVGDGLEISKKTDPLSYKDQDRDGMSNDWETIYGTIVYADDAAKDKDGDGVANIIEYLRNTLPNDASSVPQLVTWYVDAVKGNDANDGSSSAPFATLNKAHGAASNGDTIKLASGTYSQGYFLSNKSVRFEGPADRSASIVSNYSFINTMKWGGLYNIRFQSNGTFTVYSGRNVTFGNVELILSSPVALNPGSKLILDHALVTSNGSASAAITTQVRADNRYTGLYLYNTTIAGFPLGIRWDKGVYFRINNSILANTVDVENAYGFQFQNTLSSDGVYTAFNSNMTGDPRFVDAANGDYHLLPDSPAVDTGNPRINDGKEPAGYRLNLGFYGGTAEAAIAVDSDKDGMPDGWEKVVGLNPQVADHQLDSDSDGVVNLLEYKAGTHPLNKNSRRGLLYYFLNPGFFKGNIEAISLADSTYLYGARYVPLKQFEKVSLDGTAYTQGLRFYSNNPVAFSSEANGTDMPTIDWMSGHEFVVPHFRWSHTYYIISPYANATVTVKTDKTRTYKLNRGKVITIDGGSLNTLSAIIRSDVPILVSHAASITPGSSRVHDVYAVPPASREVMGIQTRYVTLGALEDNTQVTVYLGDGSEKKIVLNAGGRYLLAADNKSAQGQGNAVRIVADKPVAAIQSADSDGLEATALWDPVYSGRVYALPIDSQYIAVACKQASTINLYENGVVVETQTCTPSGNTPGKAYFGKAVNGVNLTAGQYLISDNPVYLIYESGKTNDEKNLLGKL